MSDVRARLVDALRKHRQGPGPSCRCCGVDYDAPTYTDHLADALLSLPGIAIVDRTEIEKRIRYNSHDLGEFGSFIRLEYALNILAAAESVTK